MAGSFCKYHCNYCGEDINDIRVKCSECLDFDLCLQCFSCGAEIGSHRSDHSYQLIDCGTFAIFSSSDGKWRALEEMALLEAIEQYGYGNWTDIADSVGHNVTADEAKDHYSNYYILGNIGRAVWKQTDTSDLSMRDHTGPVDGPLSPSLTTPLPAITDVNQKDEDSLGYLPKRDDFEREYDNECEALVSTLSMNAGEDDDIETNLKIAHISMYRMRLKERFRKKQIAREYGLVSHFFKSHNAFKDTTHSTPQKNSNNVNKKNSKQTSSQDNNESQLKSPFDDKYKPFLRFQSYEESRELFQNIQREKEIKSKIKELIRYRKNGLKRMSETAGFESARSERQKRKENKKKSIPNASIGSAHKRLLGMATKTAAETTKDQNSTVSQTTRKGTKESSELTQKDDNKLKSDKQVFDISSLPNCRLLSEREKKLCTSVRLRPSQYINLKTLILKEHNQKRKGSTSSHSSLENIDKSLRRKVFNFMVKSGWIPS